MFNTVCLTGALAFRAGSLPTGKGKLASHPYYCLDHCSSHCSICGYNLLLPCQRRAPQREIILEGQEGKTNRYSKLALNQILKGNQICSASRTNKYTDMWTSQVYGSIVGQRVSRAGVPRTLIQWRQLSGRKLPFPRSISSIPWIDWPTPCKEHWSEGKGRYLDCFHSKLCSFIVVTNTYFSCGPIQIALLCSLTQYQYLLKYTYSEKQTQSKKWLPSQISYIPNFNGLVCVYAASCCSFNNTYFFLRSLWRLL